LSRKTPGELFEETRQEELLRTLFVEVFSADDSSENGSNSEESYLSIVVSGFAFEKIPASCITVLEEYAEQNNVKLMHYNFRQLKWRGYIAKKTDDGGWNVFENGLLCTFTYVGSRADGAYELEFSFFHDSLAGVGYSATLSEGEEEGVYYVNEIELGWIS